MRAKSKTSQVIKKVDDQHPGAGAQQAGYVPRGDIGTYLSITFFEKKFLNFFFL